MKPFDSFVLLRRSMCAAVFVLPRILGACGGDGSPVQELDPETEAPETDGAGEVAPDAGPDTLVDVDADGSPETPGDDLVSEDPEVDACETSCTGRFCGPDGCGGQCGTCGPGLNCNLETGRCVAPPEPEGTQTCLDLATCIESCTTPRCAEDCEDEASDHAQIRYTEFMTCFEFYCGDIPEFQSWNIEACVDRNCDEEAEACATNLEIPSGTATCEESFECMVNCLVLGTAEAQNDCMMSCYEQGSPETAPIARDAISCSVASACGGAATTTEELRACLESDCNPLYLACRDPLPPCTAYCESIATVCSGTLSQYASTAACEEACAEFAATGLAGDRTGDTLQCRQTFLADAAGASSAGACAAAGPTGGASCFSCEPCTAPETCGGGGIPGECGCARRQCGVNECGVFPDGCGGTLECGCTPPATCGGGAVPNRCVCTPTTCEAEGQSCGTLEDGCGGILRCDRCVPPQTCGGGGVADECGCDPVECVPGECGPRADGCGGSVDCGFCADGDVCFSGGCCTPRACLPGECGAVPDGCGGTLECGGCGAGESCFEGSCRTGCDPVDGWGCEAPDHCAWDGSTIGCFPAGPAARGGDCTRDACGAGLQCVFQNGRSVCREYCRDDGDCSRGECAWDIGLSDELAACSLGCDPILGSGCNAGFGCYVVNTGLMSEVADCLTAGGLVQGFACSGVGNCAPGYGCVGGQCNRLCDLSSGSCAAGLVCTSVSGWGTYGVCR